MKLTVQSEGITSQPTTALDEPTIDPRMNKPQPISPRRRLQELLAIPDHDRTDAEWDELNELEISLAPGNRVGAKDPVPFSAPKQRSGGGGGGGGGGQKRQHRPKGGMHSGGYPPPAGGQLAVPTGNGGPSQPGQGPRQPQDQAQPGQAQPGQAPGGSGEKRKKPARKFHKRGPKPNQGQGTPPQGTPPAAE